MNESLRTAFRDAADSAEPYGDATQATATADRRRRSRTLAGSAAAAAVAVVVLAVGASSLSSTPTPPTGPGTPSSQGTADTATNQPTTTATTGPENASHAVRVNSAEAPVALLYRECRAGDCQVGLVDNGNQHFDLPDQVAEPLAVQGFEGVTLSTDGAWVGYPHDGMFTVASVYDPRLTLDVPAGPPGSTWRPYFWTQGYLDLVLAQWTGGHPTAFAIVHVGYSSNPELDFVVEQAPAGPELLPTQVGAAYYDVLSMAEISRPPSSGVWPQVQTLQERDLYTADSELGQPGLGEPGRVRDLSACLRDNETLIGPEGVPMTFTVAPETSPDQDGATVVFRERGDSVVPTAVVKGSCAGSSTTDATRFDLPPSSWTDSWLFLGPITPQSNLLLHLTDYSSDGELVVVGAGGQQTVVGQVQEVWGPVRTEVLAPGMTGGMFE